MCEGGAAIACGVDSNDSEGVALLRQIQGQGHLHGKTYTIKHENIAIEGEPKKTGPTEVAKLVCEALQGARGAPLREHKKRTGSKW